LQSPVRREAQAPGLLRRFFSVHFDPRAYTSLFFILLALASGIVYFRIAVTGISLSIGLGILLIGIPIFSTFSGMVRVISLGRLIEAMTGERMPRRPVHPGRKMSLWASIVAMLKDARTWTTLAYFILMLPLGTLYFMVAVVGLSVGIGCLGALPLAVLHALHRQRDDRASLGCKAARADHHEPLRASHSDRMMPPRAALDASTRALPSGFSSRRAEAPSHSTLHSAPCVPVSGGNLYSSGCVWPQRLPMLPTQAHPHCRRHRLSRVALRQATVFCVRAFAAR
jgi:hypothetical protein